MVDETAGDGGRNGTGGDGGNADRRAVNSTFRPTSDSGSFSYVQTGMATTNVRPWLKCNSSKVVL